MHRTDVFIVSGADVEYTKKNTSTISWWMMLYWSIILNITEIKDTWKTHENINYFLNGIIQIIIHVYLFFR